MHNPQSPSPHAANFSPTSSRLPREPPPESQSAVPLCADADADLQAPSGAAASTSYSQLLDIMTHSQTALDALRASIQQERVAFAEERELWARERELLRTRIAELERELEHQRGRDLGGQERSGITSSHAEHHEHPVIPPLVVDHSAAASASPSSAAAEQQQQQQHPPDSTDEGQPPVWQGLSPLRRPTRTFQNSEAYDKLDPTPISLNAALSPRSAHLRVPVELVDSSLDGIILKSTALPADVVARVTSPAGSDSSPQLPAQSDKRSRSSPDKDASASPDKQQHQHQQQQQQQQQTGEDDQYSSCRSDDEITKELETLLNIPPGTQPLPPTPPIPKDDNTTIQQELEADLADVPEDPCLRGPLNLRNNVNHDQAFLSVLDRKLLNEAHRILVAPPLSDDGGSEDGEPSDGAKTSDGQDEDDAAAAARPLTGDSASEKLEIKFKPSTNFGTAFGSIGT